MSKRTRFCVLFSDNEDGRPLKTRLLHNDSSREDLIQIWKQIYKDEDPVGAELVINENCVYRLDDDDDIFAFLAQAEDQYKLLPSQPLRVKLVDSRRREKHRGTSSDVSIQTVPAPPKSPIIANVTSNLSHINSNNNNMHKQSNDLPKHEGKSSARANVSSEDREHASSSWSPANSLMMLYNKYRQQNAVPVTSQNYETVANSGSISTPPRTSTGAPTISDNRDKELQSPHVPYTNQLANVLLNPPSSVSASVTNDGERKLLPDRNEAFIPQSPYSLPSAYSAFIKNFQEQRAAAQTSQSASYILQSIFNNHMRTNQPRPDEGFGQTRTGMSQFSEKSSIGGGFSTPSQHALLTHGSLHPSLPSSKPSTLLSSLADYNCKSLLAYMNGPVFNALQNCTNIDDRGEDFSKKTLKKRKRLGLGGEYKSGDATKRMRSSLSQSNIEYHYQRAVDYSQMKEEEQKMQNSAHRSHWKHLLFVAEISPSFLRVFKHAKYDEWSSEARDIYAICQPDKYMWSFLTLSKQGDLLCKRIIARIDDLHKQPMEERPEWCPEEATLNRAQTRARERLGQLQRILYSRSVNMEAKNMNAAREMDKMSMQEKNLSIVEAYQQRQHALLQNSGLLRAAELQHPAPPQARIEQPRQPSLLASIGGTRCSSVTSSPISMASPVFEDNCSAGSGCSESSSQDDQQNSDGLTIVENAETRDSSPEQAYNRRSVSPLPFVRTEQNSMTPPGKWTSTAITQVADL